MRAPARRRVLASIVLSLVWITAILIVGSVALGFVTFRMYDRQPTTLEVIFGVALFYLAVFRNSPFERLLDERVDLEREEPERHDERRHRGDVRNSRRRVPVPSSQQDSDIRDE